MGLVEIAVGFTIINLLILAVNVKLTTETLKNHLQVRLREKDGDERRPT